MFKLGIEDMRGRNLLLGAAGIGRLKGSRVCPYFDLRWRCILGFLFMGELGKGRLEGRKLIKMATWRIMKVVVSRLQDKECALSVRKIVALSLLNKERLDIMLMFFFFLLHSFMYFDNVSCIL